MPDPTLRGKLAFAMYLVDFEAENLPGPDRNLCKLATSWGEFRIEPGCSSLAQGYYELADRMIAHWDHHADQATLERAADAEVLEAKAELDQYRADCLAQRRQWEQEAGCADNG